MYQHTIMKIWGKKLGKKKKIRKKKKLRKKRTKKKQFIYLNSHSLFHTLLD